MKYLFGILLTISLGASQAFSQGLILVAEEEAPSSTDTAVTSAITLALANRDTSWALPENYYDYAKFNDLRTVRDFDRQDNATHPAPHPNWHNNIPTTSNTVLQAMSAFPEKFTGENTPFHFKPEGKVSAYGPTGHPAEQCESSRNGRWVFTSDLQSGENCQSNKRRKAFKTTHDPVNKRTNTILGVSYEKIVNSTLKHYPDAEGLKYVYDADLLLYVHSDAKGYYFKRINVTIRPSRNLDLEDKVIINQAQEDIPLSATDFELHIALSTQTAYLVDKNHNIKRVYPITAGAMDVRNQLDGKVDSMTLQVPDALRNRDENSQGMRAEFQPFSLENSVLIKRSHWSSNRINTANRIYPAYYQGRPFISLIDERYVTTREDGSTNYYDAYRWIGMHYQIKSSLKRGFMSHGCLRTGDYDLYILDSVINHGPKDKMKVSVKYFQDQFSENDSIFPKIVNSYKKAIYSSLPSDNVVRCPSKNSSHTVKRYGNYHSVADIDCLQKVELVNQPVSGVLNYLKGNANHNLSTLFWDIEHTPIRKQNAINALLARGFTDSDLANLRLRELETMVSSNQMPQFTSLATSFETPARYSLQEYNLRRRDIVSRRAYLDLKRRRNNLNSTEHRDYHRYLFYHYCVNQPDPNWAVQNCPRIVPHL